MAIRHYHLAQANIGLMRAPLDDPIMEGFVNQLEYINSVADRSQGFIWRLQTEEGDATAVRAFEEELILFNMSVWESIESLYNYVYRNDHLGPLRDRKKWFRPMSDPHMVLWWIPAGHIPTVEEAKARLDILRRKGSTPKAFTFKKYFPVPGELDGDNQSIEFEDWEWTA